ncbi:S41 family peptidase [Fimbriimonas ginsengisoli]|uniref:Carboxyl-terminal protease n=1 Tax=Fimbriimonas ginsengisoli Gsoil 348 TaxID=661478 RepID=A0A068NPI8_FIMGI|nr:S41 family peptidase [Fimbriimonas ginsengisoli]AIE83494.1 carboxyl-terminal protease [Fimbriimonas ginsengisoli Gsoil 348]
MNTSKNIAAILGIAGCLVLGFSYRDLQQGQLPPIRSVNMLFGVKTTAKTSPEQVFKQSYQRILSSYVHPVKAQDLKYAGMSGLMASLGDPHTLFLPPAQAQEFADETRANFFGVGAKLSSDPRGAKVAVVFDDGPAYAAGLRKDDVIVSVEGKSVAGLDVTEIVKRVKGPEGTLVHLLISRPGTAKPTPINIRRARIISPTVEGVYFKESNVGYLNVTQFAEPTTMQFERELDKLERNPMKGLVIDLRGNPGGLLETAVDMLSLFVRDKVAVKMRFRDGHEETAHTSSGALRQFNYPVAILINEDSASAAEIFAGVLKDYNKAILVGNHSYGKASVQNVFPMVDNSSAKITIARYYLPMTPFIGRKVDEDGVFLTGGLEPSVKVDLDWDKTEPVLGEPKRDSQLARAIQVLQDKAR